MVRRKRNLPGISEFGWESKTSHPSGLSRSGLGHYWKFAASMPSPCTASLMFIPQDKWPNLDDGGIEYLERLMLGGKLYDALARLAELGKPHSTSSNTLTVSNCAQRMFNIRVTSLMQRIYDINNDPAMSINRSGEIMWSELPDVLKKQFLPQYIVASRVEEAHATATIIANANVPVAVVARWLYPAVLDELNRVVQPDFSANANRWVQWFESNNPLSEFQEAFALLKTILPMLRVSFDCTNRKTFERRIVMTHVVQSIYVPFHSNVMDDARRLGVIKI